MIPGNRAVSGILDHIRASGMVYEAAADSYVITAGRGQSRRPILTIPPDLLSEYLDDLARRIEDDDPDAEALLIAQTHIAEDLSAGPGGESHVVALGFRREGGRARYYTEYDFPDVAALPPGEYEWRADRPS